MTTSSSSSPTGKRKHHDLFSSSPSSTSSTPSSPTSKSPRHSSIAPAANDIFLQDEDSCAFPPTLSHRPRRPHSASDSSSEEDTGITPRQVPLPPSPPNPTLDKATLAPRPVAPPHSRTSHSNLPYPENTHLHDHAIPPSSSLQLPSLIPHNHVPVDLEQPEPDPHTIQPDTTAAGNSEYTSPQATSVHSKSDGDSAHSLGDTDMLDNPHVDPSPSTFAHLRSRGAPRGDTDMRYGCR